MIRKNTWVKIHTIILKPEERSKKLPNETKKHPLECWMKGYLSHDADIGDEVSIITLTGREENGTLTKANPAYLHTYGAFVPEILKIDAIVKQALREGSPHE